MSDQRIILTGAVQNAVGDLVVPADTFAAFVGTITEPVVVCLQAKRLLASTYTYRLAYRGFIVTCTTKQPLTLPDDAEIIEAKPE
jgi:hypothetical protein